MPTFPKFLIFSAFPFPFPKKNYATTFNIEAPFDVILTVHRR